MRIPDAFTLAEILGATEDETVIVAAERVVRERDLNKTLLQERYEELVGALDRLRVFSKRQEDQETVIEAATRVVRERDEARRDLAANATKLSIARALLSEREAALVRTRGWFNEAVVRVKSAEDALQMVQGVAVRERDEALVRARAAEDAISIHSARHLEALRLLDEQDGDLVGAVRRVVAYAKAGWAEAKRLESEAQARARWTTTTDAQQAEIAQAEYFGALLEIAKLVGEKSLLAFDGPYSKWVEAVKGRIKALADQPAPKHWRAALSALVRGYTGALPPLPDDALTADDLARIEADAIRRAKEAQG